MLPHASEAGNIVFFCVIKCLRPKGIKTYIKLGRHLRHSILCKNLFKHSVYNYVVLESPTLKQTGKEDEYPA